MASTRVTVRSLAAESGIRTALAVKRLQEAGFSVARGGDRIPTERIPAARESLGLRRRPEVDTGEDSSLSEAQIVVRMLRPLAAKGKRGRTHTTPVENVYGRGIPDHQKGQALRIVDELVRDGLLGRKISQGRTHVWITREGLARLARAEQSESDL